MKIALVGTGNIAAFVLQKLQHSLLEISTVIGRKPLAAIDLPLPEHTTYHTSIAAIPANTDMVLLAVADKEVEKIFNALEVQNKLVIYFSGILPLSLFSTKQNTMACIWPIYSIQKNNLPKENNIPLVINNLDTTKEEMFLQFVQSLSTNVTKASEHQKEILHLCATIANNFSNHLYTLTQHILEKNDMDFSLLLPLINNTTQKLATSQPHKNQTGAAIRGDNITMQKHVALLKDNANSIALYTLMSQMIEEYYAKK